MERRSTSFAAIVLLALPLTLAACDKPKGPAEKAGSEIDKAGQKIEDAVNPPGPMEKAGRTVDSAINDTNN